MIIVSALRALGRPPLSFLGSAGRVAAFGASAVVAGLRERGGLVLALRQAIT